MQVCVYACTYACMFVFMRVCVRACVRLRPRVCLSARACSVGEFACLPVCMLVRACQHGDRMGGFDACRTLHSCWRGIS